MGFERLTMESTKLCECGCGATTSIAKYTARWFGYIKGRPKRFIKGHSIPKESNIIRVDGAVAYMEIVNEKQERFEAIIDAADIELVRTVRRWCVEKLRRGYSLYAFGKAPGVASPVKLHRLITGALPGQEVDHVNHNGLDNRRENLRICTRSQNNENRRGASKGSATGIRGVYPHGSKWTVRIHPNGRDKYIGVFDTIEAAERAAIAARQQYMTHSPECGYALKD